MLGLAFAVGTMLAAGVTAPSDEPQLPGWMTGCWETHDGDSWTEECWMAPRGGLMLGASRSGKGDQVTEWEAMQIVLRDKTASDHAIVRMAFWAEPNGTGRTAFGWSPRPMPGVTFYNAANDYPQRIRYWREGDALIAEIAMEDGSKPMRWTYRRAAAP
jgi:hypothetical protein